MPVEAGAEETQRRRSEVPDNSLKGPNAGSAPIKETRDPLGEDMHRTKGIRTNSAMIGTRDQGPELPDTGAGTVMEFTKNGSMTLKHNALQFYSSACRWQCCTSCSQMGAEVRKWREQY